MYLPESQFQGLRNAATSYEFYRNFYMNHFLFTGKTQKSEKKNPAFRRDLTCFHSYAEALPNFRSGASSEVGRTEPLAGAYLAQTFTRAYKMEANHSSWLLSRVLGAWMKATAASWRVRNWTHWWLQQQEQEQHRDRCRFCGADPSPPARTASCSSSSLPRRGRENDIAGILTGGNRTGGKAERTGGGRRRRRGKTRDTADTWAREAHSARCLCTRGRGGGKLAHFSSAATRTENKKDKEKIKRVVFRHLCAFYWSLKSSQESTLLCVSFVRLVRSGWSSKMNSARQSTKIPSFQK